MTLFLTSSPCIYEHSPATLNPENGFLDRLRAALPKDPRVLNICSDPEGHALTEYYAQDMAGAFQRAGIVFKTCRVLDNLSRDKAKQWIKESDLIILMGGHVPTQNAFFQSIGLKELLAGYPGVIMGISAGTMNAAETVYAQPESEGETAPTFRRFYPGLGLTSIMVCPHYQQVKDWCLDGKKLYGEITEADSRQGYPLYIFPDGTYIYKDDKDYAIYGKCWRMKDGITELLADDGGHIKL